jgi:hypothetical protein
MRMSYILALLLTLGILGANGLWNAAAALPQGDFVIVHEKAPAFKGGLYEGTILQNRAVTIKSHDKNRTGVYTSPETLLTYPALQVVPSWIIQSGQGDGWLLQMQLMNDDHEASPWLYVAGSGDTRSFNVKKVQECLWAKVAGDTITLKKAAVSLRYRVFFFGSRMSPSLTRFEVAGRVLAR